MPSEVERAYMAGLLDGEGHIGITLLSQPNGGKRHELSVTVTNTKIDALQQIAADWDGKIAQIRKRREGWSEVADIRWNSESAVRMLEAVLPYLRIKQEQARIAIRFGQTIRDRNRRRTPLTEQEWQVREDLRLAIRGLNRRAPGRQEPPQVERPPLTCQYCGEQFTSYQKRRKYCSQACNMKAGRDAYEERTRSIRPCALCGTEFLARSTQKYCSIKCGRAMQPSHSTKPSATSWRHKQSPNAN